MAKLSIRDLDLQGKPTFLRVDFNVPVDGSKVLDDTRIRAALPTIELALKRGARLILASHLGRPRGEPVAGLNVKPVQVRLAELLHRKVAFAQDCIGKITRRSVQDLPAGEALMLQNLRFHPGETANDQNFAKALASLASEYVNDAFGTAHRAHASTVGVPKILGRGAAGLLMQRELDYLSHLLDRPAPPVVAILGGAKVSDKIEVIVNLLNLADTILVGGAMAYTFLKATGKKVGTSLCEEDRVAKAAEILECARRKGVDFRLPVDHVVAERPGSAEAEVTADDQIPDGKMGLDIGPETAKDFKQAIARARTIVWNGPLGMFEMDRFAAGTLSVARAVAASEGMSVVGGGDSVSAIVRAGVVDRITHLSTGGGASLEFLAGKSLPGIEALSEAVDNPSNQPGHPAAGDRGKRWTEKH